MGKVKVEKEGMQKKEKRMKQVMLRILRSNRCERCLHSNVLVENPEPADNLISDHRPRNSGFKVNSKHKLYWEKSCSCIRSSKASGSNELDCSATESSWDLSRNGKSGYLRIDKKKRSTRSFSFIQRRAEARSMSVVEWVMSLTNRSSSLDFTRNKTSSLLESDSLAEDCSTKETSFDEIHESENESTNEISTGEVEKSALLHEDSSTSSLVTSKESTESILGWPLLVLKTSVKLGALMQHEDGELYMVNPLDHLRLASPKSRIKLGSEEAEDSAEEISNLAALRKQAEKLELVLKLNSSGCKIFSYEELNKATRQFSSENLIGEGGCSNVYKGLLSGCKLIAVKVLKHYKEAFKDFSLEVEVMSLLKHRHITPLVGACIEDDYLILVYDFLPKGSLEENLEANSKKYVLPWKLRFKVALAIADALNYLHNECPRPVIHRDVKSSNILLSHDLQPQLSDFGLAVWGPKDSDYMMLSDVVGTFGYLAPEYVMHGMISNKVDVYAFGVVLLELLTGKKPICSEDTKGQQNLVKWATPLLEKGDLKALLDPRLEKDFNIVQMNKMILAATLCTSQSARLRPNVSQVLELLSGKKDEEDWVNSYAIESNEEEDDGFPTEIIRRPSFDVSSLSLHDDTSLLCSDQNSPASKHRLKLKDYLLKPQK